MGIDCRMVPSIDEENHVWNIVSMGNLYYNLDATWDEGTTDYQWFLLSDSNFVRHTRDAEYRTTSFYNQYPMGKYNYNPATAVKITAQPQSVTVPNGETAKVTVKATGNGLTYKWYFKDAGASSYTYTSSFTGNTYSVKMNADRDGRRVLCKVYDQYGNMVQTNSATLNMAATLKITSQPKSVTVKPGAIAKVTVGATGEGLSYRWYYKNPGDSSFTYTSSFKSNTYSVTMNADRNGRQVLCRVYDKYGNVVQSNSATLKMDSGLRIVTQPKTAYVQLDKKINLSVVAEGEGLKYSWYVKDVGDPAYVKSSITSRVYAPTMTENKDGRYAYCVVTDKYGNSVKTNTVRIWLSVSIVRQPVSITVAKGATAKVTVQAVGNGLTYRWYYKNPGDSSFTYTSSFTGNSYSVTMTAARAGRMVLCRVYDKYGNVVQTNTVALNMK